MPVGGPGTLPALYVPSVPSNTLAVDGHEDDLHELDRQEIRALWQAVGVPNLIVDPGLNLWPDGTSFTSIANNTWGPAGLIYMKSGAVVHDLLRSTDVPAVATLSPLANYSVHLDVTTADSSIAAGDWCAIATRIEGYDWLALAQRQFTLPFWVKAAKTGVHYVYARNSGNDRTCVIAYTISAADTWEQKAVTFPASPSAGTWDYTNGRGIEIGWTLAAGTTFHTTAGAWQTGNFRAASDQVNELDSTANNFKLALIGPPTLGAYAAPFCCLPFGAEERRALRYYEEIGDGASNHNFGAGLHITTDESIVNVPYKVRKRATPTISVSAAGDFFVYQGPTPTTCDAMTTQAIGVDMVAMRPGVPATPLTVGDGTALAAGNANARIKVAARIP